MDRLNFDDINYFIKRDRHFVDHPMCRCSIIPIKAKVIIFMPYISKVLVKEYVGECKESVIWRN